MVQYFTLYPGKNRALVPPLLELLFNIGKEIATMAFLVIQELHNDFRPNQH